jgi:hypothetical protein
LGERHNANAVVGGDSPIFLFFLSLSSLNALFIAQNVGVHCIRLFLVFSFARKGFFYAAVLHMGGTERLSKRRCARFLVKLALRQNAHHQKSPATLLSTCAVSA